MIIHPLKKYILSFNKYLLVSIIAAVILACSGGDDPDENAFSVFTPEIIQQPLEIPFFVSNKMYYPIDYDELQGTSLTELNTQDWQNYFGNKIQKEEIEWLVYQTTPKELTALKEQINNKFFDKKQPHFSTIKKLAAKKNKGIIDYLIIAKRAETLLNPNENGWEPVNYNLTALDSLQQVCKNRFSIEKNFFLKDRYGFQVSRALSISDHAGNLSFLEKEYFPVKENSSLYYRTLGSKARSLYLLKKYAEANHIYAKIFDEFPPLKIVAHQSFHPQEEEDWKQTLALCNTSEKIAAWQLAGIYNDPLQAMKAIYAIDPKSEKLKLLMVRAVNQTEKYLLNNPLSDYYFFYAPYKYVYSYNSESEREQEKSYLDYASSTQQFFRKVLRENKMADRALWQLALAHISLLQEDVASADNIISQITDVKNDSLLLGQLEITKGILAVQKLNKIDTRAENEIFDHIKKIRQFTDPALRNANAIRYITSRMSGIYQNQKDFAKQELTYPTGRLYLVNSERTKGILSFLERKHVNEFEDFISSNYVLKENELQRLLIVNYLYEYKFNEAAAIYNVYKEDPQNVFSSNPFNIRIVDCHECDDNSNTKNTYNTFTLLNKLIELKNNGENAKDKEEKAKSYFLLANGLYNITWYGNLRYMRSEDKVDYDYSFVVYSELSGFLKKTSFFDCSESLKYYQLAANLTSNKEFKAKCTWMMAKCEHNNWLNAEHPEYKGDFKAGKYFAQFKQMNNTRYYNEVLNECGYFKTYINVSVGKPSK